MNLTLSVFKPRYLHLALTAESLGPRQHLWRQGGRISVAKTADSPDQDSRSFGVKTGESLAPRRENYWHQDNPRQEIHWHQVRRIFGPRQKVPRRPNSRFADGETAGSALLMWKHAMYKNIEPNLNKTVLCLQTMLPPGLAPENSTLGTREPASRFDARESAVLASEKLLS